jgi:hypothetical protein
VGLWSLRDRYGAPKADRGTSLGSVRASDIVFKLPAGSLGPGLLRMYKARRCTRRKQVLEPPATYGEGRSSDKEAESETPPSARAPDRHRSNSPCCRHANLALLSQKTGKPCGARAGMGL